MNQLKEIQLVNIVITDASEIEAVKDGKVEGTIYSDGEVFADVVSLLRWRNEQPLSVLEETMRAAVAS